MKLKNFIAYLCVLPLTMAGDFWQDKDPSQWSQKEITRLRTNSPWARDASVEFSMGRMGNMPGGRGEGPGGGMGRGGGMGGPGGGPGGPAPDMGSGGPGGGMSTPKMVVRWESAAPLLDAENRAERAGANTAISEWAREFYVIGVSGLPSGGRRGGEEPTQGQDVRNPMGLGSMQAVTSLKRKGKEPIQPARVERLQTASGPMIAFLFPRTDPIDADDKEVNFESGLGPLGIKCKFVVKAMTYHGKLAL